MEIVLLAIGKTANKHISECISEYEKRLTHYIPFRLELLRDLKNTKSLSQEQQKKAEGEMLLSYFQPSDHVAILDERGKEFTSPEFADLLQLRMSSGLKRLVFVIGGPYGFSEDVYARADSKISLSRMTFNHEMVRLFFVEQIYRAMTILRGEPYHH